HGIGGGGGGEGVEAVGGHGVRGGEALAGEEDGVGQEAGQLAQVLRAALAQVAEGFGGHARRHRGQRHQLRVRGGLAAQRDQRLARGGQRRSTRLNSSHSQISYAVFCLKKKKTTSIIPTL